MPKKSRKISWQADITADELLRLGRADRNFKDILEAIPEDCRDAEEYRQAAIRQYARAI